MPPGTPDGDLDLTLREIGSGRLGWGALLVEGW